MFRITLILFFGIIAAYTALTISQHGLAFVQAFIANLLQGDWSGQFALDFALYLALSALWIAWRGGFAPASLVMAAVAGVLGMAVFAPYLLVLHHRSKGDLAQLLLGVHAPNR